MATLIDNTRRASDAPSGLALRARELAAFPYDLTGENETVMCTIPFNTPIQTRGGVMRLCPASSTYKFNDDVNMGEVPRRRLEDIWRSDKYRHIRRTLLSGQNLEPYCNECEYRFRGPAWMLQLHLALFAYNEGLRDEELLGMLRRWMGRHEEYAARASELGLNPLPKPDVDLGTAPLNAAIPESLVDAGALPVYIAFDTLNRCNVSCTMCAPAVEHDDEGVPRGEYWRLGVEDVVAMCDGLNVKTAHFVGSYSEPLLNKDIFKLVALTKSSGAFTAITTNATVLTPEFGRRLLDAGLDMMTISLHGATKATAEGIMRNCNFDRIVANIRALQAEKAKRGLTTPDLYINFVSQLANVHEMPGIVSLAGDLGIRHVHVVHLIDRGLADTSGSLLNHPQLVGPAVAEARRRAAELGVNVHISSAYTEIMRAYEGAVAA